MFWSLVRPDRILLPITRSAAVTTSLEAGELAVVMITCGGRNRGGMTHDGQRCERIPRRLLPPCHCGLCCFWPIRNANLVKAMLIATRASAGARKRRSTRPSRTPFQHPIRFQSSSRHRPQPTATGKDLKDNLYISQSIPGATRKDRRMNPSEKFLRFAAECEFMAKFTHNPGNKTVWSRMA